MPSHAGSRIRLRRQELGMTQAGLATRVGVHESTVTAWESGKHFPRRYQGKIEAVLAISLDSSTEHEAAFVPADDDEARIWAMDEPEEWRLKIITWKRQGQARAAS